VELSDANGVRNPKAENLVKFEAEGPGTIIGVGNANPVSLESCSLPERKAWQGRCMVVIKAGKETGTFVLTANSDGLQAGMTEINVR
jgi:beta-galactosidase